MTIGKHKGFEDEKISKDTWRLEVSTNFSTVEVVAHKILISCKKRELEKTTLKSNNYCDVML